MIGEFRSVLCVSVFQDSFLVLVIVIDGNEKRSCGGGFWTSEFACFWKAQLSLARNYFIMTKSQFLVQQICLPIFFFQALHQTLQTTKINLKKTVSLNSFFYKSQLQSASIFFKFVHPCLILFYIPSVVPSLYVLSSGYVYVPLSLVSVPPAILNPLNYNIKIEILIYCPYTFLIRVVGTICRNINETLFPDNVLNSHDHSVF